MSTDYISALQPCDLELYKEKLTLSGLTDCPYTLSEDVWRASPKHWPPVGFGDIRFYLTNTPGIHTKESMKLWRELASVKLWKSGQVQTVYHMKPEQRASSMVLRADVGPSSHDVTQPPHQPWVAVSKSGAIVTAHCDCTAGLKESCLHIGALLFKMEHIVRAVDDAREAACIDDMCHMKGVRAARLADINLYGKRAKKKVPSRLLPPPPTEEEKRQFIMSLAAATANVPVRDRPVGLSLFEGLKESCLHIGALLFKMEHIVRAVDDAREAACIDDMCHMKGVRAARLADINLYGKRAKKKVPSRLLPPPPTEEEKRQFIMSLAAATANVPVRDRPVGLSLFEG